MVCFNIYIHCIFFIRPCDTWDLSSPTREWSCSPYTGSTRDVLICCISGSSHFLLLRASASGTFAPILFLSVQWGESWKDRLVHAKGCFFIQRVSPNSESGSYTGRRHLPWPIWRDKDKPNLSNGNKFHLKVKEESLWVLAHWNLHKCPYRGNTISISELVYNPGIYIYRIEWIFGIFPRKKNCKRLSLCITLENVLSFLLWIFIGL